MEPVQPVAWECWIPCRDAVGREARVLVAITDGCLVVLPPSPGSVRFGPDQVEAAQQFRDAVSLGVRLLEQQQEQALLGKLQALRERSEQRPVARRHRRRR